MSATRTTRIEVDYKGSELRLDQLLAEQIPGLSRRKARVLIDIGGVFVDGARVKVAGRRLRPGQMVEAHIGGALQRATGEVGRAARARDEAKLPAYTELFRDRDMVLVNKPSGLLTAPTPESDRNNLQSLLERDLDSRVYVVHRIDLETSGVLVFARTSLANRALSDRFRQHDLERAYIAVVAGVLPEGTDNLDVAEAVAGKRARTHLHVVERLAHATVLRVTLETGRTHQIRLHCQHLGHPVLGDPRYGAAPCADVCEGPPRMALHATLLGFRHPRTAEPVRFEVPLPEPLERWLEALRAVEK